MMNFFSRTVSLAFGAILVGVTLFVALRCGLPEEAARAAFWTTTGFIIAAEAALVGAMVSMGDTEMSRRQFGRVGYVVVAMCYLVWTLTMAIAYKCGVTASLILLMDVLGAGAAGVLLLGFAQLNHSTAEFDRTSIRIDKDI